MESDAADLVADPLGVAAAYSARIGLPARPEALNWAADERDEWRIFAAWHRDAAPRMTGTVLVPLVVIGFMAGSLILAPLCD